MRNSPSLTLIAAIVLVASTAAEGPAPLRQSQQPAPPPQQQPAVPPVSYDVDVTLVEVDAVVTDADGRVVRDLRKDEFQVFENEVAQSIDRVSFVEIPVERSRARRMEMPALVADVRTNRQPFDGRLYVLLLDDLHTSLSRTDRVKAAASRFIEENLGPSDLAAVVHMAGAGASQGFTSDAALLLASVSRFSGRQLRSETLNLIDKYNERMQLTSGAPRGAGTPDPETIRDPDEPLRANDARVVLDSIADIARRVEPVRGRRKSLIWFGEGIAYDMFNAKGQRQASLVLESERRAVAAAGRANLVIYGVDARGLAGVNQEVMQLTSTQDPTSTMDPSRLGRELARSQDNLRQIAGDTGGFAAVNTDEFANAFERVVEESSAYYLLGYYPKQDVADGVYRSLEVRVSRPGARVRARRGYALSRGAAGTFGSVGADVPPALREALASPVPRSGLPMAVHAAAFSGRAGKASVLVTIEYAASAFEGRGAKDDRLQASVVAVDNGGQVRASDHVSVDLSVKPDTEQAMKVLGFRTHARLELEPGRYQLRAGAVVTVTGLSGSVYRDLEVPDFSGGGLQMSGIELTCVVGAYVPTAHADERLRAVLPAPPTAMRDFRNDDQLAVYAEVYEGGGVPPKDVTFTTSVRRLEGQLVARQTEDRTAGELKEAGGGYSARVPLADLAPGEYVLRLEAATATSEPVGHEVAFRVWAVPAR